MKILKKLYWIRTNTRAELSSFKLTQSNTNGIVKVEVFIFSLKGKLDSLSPNSLLGIGEAQQPIVVY